MLSRARHLQQLANVADVTMEVNAGTAANAPEVEEQMTDLLVNNTIAARPLLAPPCLGCLPVQPSHAHTMQCRSTHPACAARMPEAVSMLACRLTCLPWCCFTSSQRTLQACSLTSGHCMRAHR